MNVLFYISKNLNAVPIKELTPILKDSDAAPCDTPLTYLSVGHFQGLQEGCFCSPYFDDDYIGSEKNNDCDSNGCTREEDIEEMGPK